MNDRSSSVGVSSYDSHDLSFFLYGEDEHGPGTRMTRTI